MNQGEKVDRRGSMHRIDTWGKDHNIKLDVAGGNEDESVEALLAKLNQKGAKVKLLNGEDDDQQ